MVKTTDGFYIIKGSYILFIYFVYNGRNKLKSF
jgi:hypothetical protein